MSTTADPVFMIEGSSRESAPIRILCDVVQIPDGWPADVWVAEAERLAHPAVDGERSRTLRWGPVPYQMRTYSSASDYPTACGAARDARRLVGRQVGLTWRLLGQSARWASVQVLDALPRVLPATILPRATVTTTPSEFRAARSVSLSPVLLSGRGITPLPRGGSGGTSELFAPGACLIVEWTLLHLVESASSGA